MSSKNFDLRRKSNVVSKRVSFKVTWTRFESSFHLFPTGRLSNYLLSLKLGFLNRFLHMVVGNE
jgi:hypothetical protein